MMKNDNDYTKLSVGFICFIFLFAHLVPVQVVFGSNESVKVKFQFSPESIGVGEQVKVSVIVTADESLNAIEGRVIIPKEIAKIEKILDASVGVSLWIIRPSLNENNDIEFSGITPGGFRGQDILLFSFVLKGIQKGVGVLDFESLEALKNDALGTQVSVIKNNSKVEIMKQGAGENIYKLTEDIDPPESFSPILSRVDGLFGGNYFVSFDTNDKISGVDYFELSEKPILFPQRAWRRAKSPYIIGNFSIYDSVKIRAVDKFGNERFESVSLTPIASKRVLVWSILLLVVTLCFKIVWLRYRKINTR